MIMKKIKLFDVVKTLIDKDFICPTEHIGKDSTGTVVEICESQGKVGYIIEIDGEIYDFLENEIEVIEQFKNGGAHNDQN